MCLSNVFVAPPSVNSLCNCVCVQTWRQHVSMSAKEDSLFKAPGMFKKSIFKHGQVFHTHAHTCAHKPNLMRSSSRLGGLRERNGLHAHSAPEVTQVLQEAT